ncbi:RagB/SusD domain-containing protein [bacterium A37T11]|nr:RagB/SusD domain-containing protein [bacterium A37T11]
MLVDSCKLTDVTNITPPNQLSEETVITDISSADKVLTGAYAQLHKFSLIVDEPGITGSMGLSFTNGPSGGSNYAQFYNNSITSDNYVLSGIYTAWYYLINISSHIIEKTGNLNITDARKEQIVAEASFLRALAHFSLLRLYGRFYDNSSEYGIVTWDTPVKDITAKARSTVSESYQRILADLEVAIAKAPEYSSAVYASRQAALMLKAKVLLYQQEYAKAVSVADQLLNQLGTTTLEPIYDNIFKLWFRSKEVLLAPPFDDKNERNNKAYAFRSYVLPTAYYFDLMQGDNRDTTTVYKSGVNLRSGKFRNTTSNGQTLTANTEYFLRLGELYLISAEALVRNSNGDANFQTARDRINTIRRRAGMPLLTQAINNKADLLMAVLKEKQLELGCESGEDWYDLIRFTVAGDINIATYKPNVVNESRYIVPIPNESILASNAVVKQNPGYE